MLSLFLLAVAAAQSTLPPADSFCGRLHEQLPLRLSRTAPDTWERDTTGGLAGLLFGASDRTFVMQMHTVDEFATIDEVQRLAAACTAERKGAICRIEGPAAFTLQAQNKSLRIVASLGEKASVRIVNVTIQCRNDI